MLWETGKPHKGRLYLLPLDRLTISTSPLDGLTISTSSQVLNSSSLVCVCMHSYVFFEIF